MRPFLILILLIAPLACSRAPALPDPVRVSGAVKVDGQLLTDGEILFKVPGEVPTIAVVKNGSYAASLVPGPRTVEIMAYRQAKDFDMGGVIIKGSRENFLPARFNIQSTLTAEITRDGPNEFSFDVSAK